MLINIESKSGLSRKERHLLQMGFEADNNGINSQDELYIYQNKTRKKVTPTLTDTFLILKYRNDHFDLSNVINDNMDLLIQIRNEIDSLIKNDKA